MDPVSAILINKALDELTLRSEVTAQNIANANSPGYRPLRVSFEKSLRTAAGRGEVAVQASGPKIERDDMLRAGSEMRLDLELATASETAMRYAALIDLLSRQIAISRIVIKGGQ